MDRPHFAASLQISRVSIHVCTTRVSCETKCETKIRLGGRFRPDLCEAKAKPMCGNHELETKGPDKHARKLLSIMC